MTKKQKTWLWVFIAMFAIPEIIWGPTFGYTSFSKGIFDLEFRGILLAVLAIQILGALLFLVNFAKNFKRSGLLFWTTILI